jgi:protein disulfide-isomerase
MKPSLLSLLCALAVTVAASASPLPYDPSADAHVALVNGAAQARSEGKYLLVVFGANWCEDCRDLDKAMRGSSAPLIGSRFVVVKIDVGNFDRNLDLAQRYGNPIAKGIPAAVLITPDEQLLYSTVGGELADARRMGERGIYAFLSRILNQYQPSGRG